LEERKRIDEMGCQAGVDASNEIAFKPFQNAGE
jgi:hypothetical protein